jgi:integrase
MLKQSVDEYLALRRALGFRLWNEEYMLHDFARWASDRGETHVRASTVIEWAAAGRSPWRREQRLRTVALFARHARAADQSHEVPPIRVFGRRPIRRLPHIYTADEVKKLLEAAARLAPIWPLRPQVFTTLFGLLASAGLRVSEALSLRFGDVTVDGLVIRKTKFNKTRLVPLHPTAAAALGRYMRRRRRASALSDYVFISRRGGRLSYATVLKRFLQLAQETGIRSGLGTRGARIHDLRHTFAVRALENSPGAGGPVGREMRALSTYLGHVNLASTCWYLHSTPQLMRGIADACELFLQGGAR